VFDRWFLYGVYLFFKVLVLVTDSRQESNKKKENWKQPTTVCMYDRSRMTGWSVC